MKLIKYLFLFISLFNFVINAKETNEESITFCNQVTPSKRSDCHGKPTLSTNYLSTCCYFKGIESYARVEKWVALWNKEIEDISKYISGFNGINGNEIFYLDCKSFYYKLGIIPFIPALLL